MSEVVAQLRVDLKLADEDPSMTVLEIRRLRALCLRARKIGRHVCSELRRAEIAVEP